MFGKKAPMIFAIFSPLYIVQSSESISTINTDNRFCYKETCQDTKLRAAFFILLQHDCAFIPVPWAIKVKAQNEGFNLASDQNLVTCNPPVSREVRVWVNGRIGAEWVS
jgi:hypothetical protein